MFASFGVRALVAVSLATCASLAAGCGGATEDDGLTDTTDDLTGGGSESGYHPAGFILATDLQTGKNPKRICDAVLLGPRIAATSAGCLLNKDGRPKEMRWNVAFGALKKPDVYTAQMMEPMDDPTNNPPAKDVPWENQVVLIFTDKVVKGVAPATIAAAGEMPKLREDCPTRFIGYASGSRRSMVMCVQSGEERYGFVALGAGGATEAGDEGGPLMIRGTNKVVGIMTQIQSGMAKGSTHFTRMDFRKAEIERLIQSMKDHPNGTST